MRRIWRLLFHVVRMMVIAAILTWELRRTAIQTTDWREISIDLYGGIAVSNPGSAGMSIGTIPVTTFSGEDPGDPIQVTNPENRLGPPTTQLAGVSGAGLLMQRTVLRYCLPLTVRTLLTVLIFVLLALSGFWYDWKTQSR